MDVELPEIQLEISLQTFNSNKRKMMEVGHRKEQPNLNYLWLCEVRDLIMVWLAHSF